MKNLMTMMLLSISINSMADVIKEFDPAEEMACQKELEAQGCVNNSGVENPRCIEKRLKKLSISCQAIQKEKNK